MPPRLALHLLGAPALQLDGASVTTSRRKAIALLAYLAVNRSKHAREALSALLWPDFEQARAYASLRNTLWEVSQALGEGWVLASRDTLELNPDADIWLDVRQFDELLAAGRVQNDPALRLAPLADAVTIYRNHFLTGFSLKDAHPFNEWAFAEAEELRRKLAEALTLLIESHRALEQAEAAIPYARRLVALDPLDEAAHRRLMEVYLQAGQHSAALKQYQTLEQTLRAELNLDPQPETRELYKRIRKREAKPVRPEARAPVVTPQHNLPVQLASFIGREKELAEVGKLLARNRLVTLVGAGGIGKTSLSLQVGHKALYDFPNGVWFVALDALSDPELVPQTVAAVLDIREGVDRPMLEKLSEALCDQTALLILDNCEHLQEACAQLTGALLQRCPKLKILASSRETLNVPGEAVYTMPALPIPEGDLPLEKLIEYPSVRLFAERAALALSTFELNAENYESVVAICRKVDGIPLAIELAAARVNFLQVDEILKQLGESFALLANDSRLILPRHQTIQASMDWSWGLLSAPEQALLRQLSVFAGGWTLEAAQAICLGEVLALTEALVRKSLIVVKQESGRATRYHFHEMVRQYAQARALESEDCDEVCFRHLDYFVELSEQAERELRGPSRVDWMERLTDERNNIRAALRWADKYNVEAGLYLSSRLMRYWESSNLPEGTQWLRNFIHKPESKNFPRARAHALHTHAWLLTWLQKFEEAYVVAQESLSLFRAAGDRPGEVDALIILGNISQFKDEVDASIEIGRQALAISRELGDVWREANSYNYLGWGFTGNWAQMFTHWEKAIELYRAAGDQIDLANLLGLMGQFRVLNGDLEIGEQNADEALVLWRANKRANIWENPKIAKGLIASIQGRYEEAQALLTEVRAAAEQTGNLMSKLWADVRLGYVAFHAGNLLEARQLLTESARQFIKGENTIGAVFALEGLAGFFATVGKTDRAVRLLGFADALREKIKNTRPPLEQADVDMSLAACLARMDQSAYEQAYAEGQLLTVEAAFALASGES